MKWFYSGLTLKVCAEKARKWILLKYTDPTGEFLIEAILLGTFINTAIQCFSGNIKGPEDFFLSAGVGAFSGAVGSGAGSLMSGVIAPIGIIGGGLTGAAGGFISGAGNAWINGFNFEQGLVAGLVGAGWGAAGGAITGSISGGITAYKHGGNILTGDGATFDQLAGNIPNENKVEIGKGMTYSNEYAKGFSDINFGENIKGLDNLHANGSLPNSNYTRNGDLVLNKKGLSVNGVTKYNGIGKGSDVFLYKPAFVSPQELFVTMGHEYIHVAQNASPYLLNSNQKEYIAYSWGQRQWLAFGKNVPNPISSIYKLLFLDYTKFQINNYYPNIVLP